MVELTCREFRKACLSDRVHPVKSLLLRAAMAEARVKVTKRAMKNSAKDLKVAAD